MPFVSEDHPDARFCVTAYRSNDDEHGVTSYYTTLNEARSEFDSVSRGGVIFVSTWAVGKMTMTVGKT
jgi:hypothetical protein